MSRSPIVTETARTADTTKSAKSVETAKSAVIAHGKHAS